MISSSTVSPALMSGGITVVSLLSVESLLDGPVSHSCLLLHFLLSVLFRWLVTDKWAPQEQSAMILLVRGCGSGTMGSPAMRRLLWTGWCFTVRYITLYLVCQNCFLGFSLVYRNALVLSQRQFHLLCHVNDSLSDIMVEVVLGHTNCWSRNDSCVPAFTFAPASTCLISHFAT